MNASFNLPPGVMPADIDPTEVDEDESADASDRERDIANESVSQAVQQAKVFDAMLRQIFPTLNL